MFTACDEDEMRGEAWKLTLELLQLALITCFLSLLNHIIHNFFIGIGQRNKDTVLSEQQSHSAAHTAAADHCDLLFASVWASMICSVFYVPK